MALKVVAAILGLIEVLAPRKVARFWLAWCCHNPEEIELRDWVTTAIRIEGLVLIGWAAWRSREEIAELRDFGYSPAEEIPQVDVDAGDEPALSEEGVASLQDGTTRFDLAVALYHAGEALPVSALVDRSEGTDWEVGRSTASATLYRMHRDGLVDRREREDARGYEYWLTDAGERALEASDADFDAEPFVTGE